MAKFGSSVRKRKSGLGAAPAVPSAAEENAVERRYSSTKPAGLELATETNLKTREDAFSQMLRLEEAGMEGSGDWRRAKQIAEEGQLDPHGTGNFLTKALSVLDAPGRLVRTVVADITNVDRKTGKELTLGAIWDSFTNDRESLAQNYGNLFGDDGYLVGKEILTGAGWKEQANDSWFEKAARGVAGFGLDVALDPLSYATAGASVMTRKGLLKMANKTVDKALREVAFDPATVRFVTNSTDTLAREGARKMTTRLRSKLSDDAMEEMLEDSTQLAALVKRIRMESAGEMLDDRVGRALAAKQYDEMPEWWLQSQSVKEPLKGGLRYMGRPVAPKVTRGLVGKGKKKVSATLRKNDKLDTILDSAVKWRSRTMSHFNKYQDIIDQFKANVPGAGTLLGIGMGVHATARAVGLRQLGEQTLTASNELAHALRAESTENLGTVMRDIVDIAQSGQVVSINPEKLAGVGPRTQQAVVNFVDQYHKVVDRLLIEAREVGLELGDIDGYVPAVISREMRDFIDGDLTEAGLRTWVDPDDAMEEVPEQHREGLAWLNEVIQGRWSQTNALAEGEQVVGATRHANERTLGRGAKVRTLGSDGLTWLVEYPNGATASYVDQTVLDQKMTDALVWLINDHNSREGVRQIKVPKWLTQRADPKTAGQATTGVMQTNPFHLVQQYHESMSRAIVEQDLARTLKAYGITEGIEYARDAGRIAYRLSNKGHAGDVVVKAERRVSKMLEDLAKKEEAIVDLNSTEPANRVVEKIGGTEVVMSRSVASNPRVQRAVGKAKAEAAAQQRAYRNMENQKAAAKRRLVAKGVSEEAAEQVVNADPGKAMRELYNEIVEATRREMMEAEITARDIMADLAAISDQTLAEQNKTAVLMRRDKRQAERAARRARQSMQSSYKTKKGQNKRIRFDRRADRAMLRTKLKERLLTTLDSWFDEAAVHGEALVSNHQSLRLARDYVDQEKWPEAAAALNRFMSETWGKDSALVRTLVSETRDQFDHQLQLLYRRKGGVRKLQGSSKKTEEWYYEARKRIHANTSAKFWFETYPDAAERAAARDLYDEMDKIIRQRDRALSDLDAEYATVWKLQQDFDDVAYWLRSMETAQGGKVKFREPRESIRFVRALREAGVLQDGDIVEWRNPHAAGPGFTIVSGFDPELASWDEIVEAVERLGFSSVEEARHAADIAAFPSEEAWLEFQASAWGQLNIGDVPIARGIEEDSPWKLADRWETNWNDVVKPHWENGNEPYEVVYDWGDGFRYERKWHTNKKTGNVELSDEAIVLRNENGDLVALLSANPRAVDAIDTLGELPGFVYIGVDPGIPTHINGTRVVKILRDKANEAEFAVFAGSGKSGYTLEGAKSSYRAAVRATEGMSDEVREALRTVDPTKASIAADASHAIQVRGQELMAKEANVEQAAKTVGKFRGWRKEMRDIQTAVNQKTLTPAEVRKRTGALVRQIVSDPDAAPQLGADAIERIADWADKVKTVTYLREGEDRTVFELASAARSVRQHAFDTDKARQSLTELDQLVQTTRLSEVMDDYQGTVDDLELLGNMLREILNLPEGGTTRYLVGEASENAAKLVRDAEAKWDDLIGGPNPLRGAAAESKTVVQTKPGWVPARAVGLLGPSFEGMAGDAAAMRFVKNILDTNMAMASPAGASLMRRYYGQVFADAMGWWKTMATVVRLPFHVRNFIGATYNNALAGVRLRNYREAAELFNGGKDSFFWKLMARGEDIDVALQSIKSERVRAAAREMFDQGMFAETMAEQEIVRRSIAELTPKGAARRAWDATLSTSGVPAVVGGKVMQGVESFHRAAAFLRYWDEAGDGALAIEWVNTVHFDYADLTTWERNLKRYVPFFVWAKNNVPLQMRALFESPGVANRYQHFFMNMDSALGDDSDLPGSQYRSGLHIGTGLIFGEDEGFYAELLFDPQLPIEDLEELRMNPLSIASLMVNSLGPQFTPLTQSGGDYMVNAPGGFNTIFQALGHLGVGDNWIREAEEGVARVHPALATYARTLVPWQSDYLAPLAEMDPARLERMGISGGYEATSPLTRLGAVATKLGASGLGATFEGTEEAYRASTAASFSLQDDIREARKTGDITLEEDEAWEERKKALKELEF